MSILLYDDYVSAAGASWSDYDGSTDETPVTFANFNLGANTSTVAIDDHRFLIAYQWFSNFAYCIVGTIDGDGVVTFGTPVNIVAATVNEIKVDILDSANVVVAYDLNSDNKTYAVVVPYSGTTIGTPGTPVDMGSTTLNNFISVAAISSTEFLVCYSENAGDGEVVYGSVSGTTITKGNTTVFDTPVSFSSPVGCNISKLASGTAIISLSDDADEIKAYLISVSGTTPVVEDTLSLYSAGTFNAINIQVERINDNKAIIAWTENADTNDCSAIIVTESSGSLSKGVIEQFSTEVAEYLAVSVPDETHAVMTYGVNTADINTVTVDISGTSLSANTPVQNLSGNYNSISSAVTLNGQWVAVPYSITTTGPNRGQVLVIGKPS